MKTVGVRRAVAGALLALALGGCSVSASVGGTKTLNMSELERSIRDKLAEANIEAKVSCPDDMEMKEGNSFECTATDRDGASRQVRVDQTDGEGNVHFELV